MAQDENDMSGHAAATAREGKFSRAARESFERGAPSANEIGRAVSEALRRTADTRDEPAPLNEFVRASCRCGTHPATGLPLEYTFKGADTMDGKDWTIKHGRPIRLKRDAFIRLAGQGVVIRAE